MIAAAPERMVPNLSKDGGLPKPGDQGEVVPVMMISDEDLELLRRGDDAELQKREAERTLRGVATVERRHGVRDRRPTTPEDGHQRPRRRTLGTHRVPNAAQPSRAPEGTFSNRDKMRILAEDFARASLATVRSLGRVYPRIVDGAVRLVITPRASVESNPEQEGQFEGHRGTDNRWYQKFDQWKRANPGGNHIRESDLQKMGTSRPRVHITPSGGVVLVDHHRVYAIQDLGGPTIEASIMPEPI